MKIAFLVLESMFYFISLLCISNKIMGHQIKRKFCFPYFVCLYATLIIVAYVFDYTAFLFAHAAIQFAQLVVVRLLSRKSKFLSFLGTYVLIYCINVVLTITVNCIFRLSHYGFSIVEGVFNLIIFTGCMICCFESNISSRIKQILFLLPTGIKFLTIISFAISAWLMSLLLSNPNLNENSTWNTTLRISLVLLSLFVCTTFPVLLITVLTNSHLKKQNEIFERELEAQANHYSALAKSNYELRRFRHDFSNIRIGITKSLNENDPQTALEMLTFGQNSLYQATDEIVPFDTGNGIVDAILSDKQSKAKVHNIAIHFSGSVPPAALSPVDLCVIFGNTVDNAIEACQKLPTDMEKTISISSICCNGYIFITIENPVAQTVTITNNFVSTTKENSNLHGFGLYSLNKTIKKYDGDLKLTSENNTFRVNMDMCLKLSSTN